MVAVGTSNEDWVDILDEDRVAFRAALSVLLLWPEAGFGVTGSTFSPLAEADFDPRPDRVRIGLSSFATFRPPREDPRKVLIAGIERKS